MTERFYNVDDILEHLLDHPDSKVVVNVPDLLEVRMPDGRPVNGIANAGAVLNLKPDRDLVLIDRSTLQALLNDPRFRETDVPIVLATG